ncbi:MAG: carboxylesterase family protein [Proteobacteria bacterium]|nr:carboxylesterase family protein [Pseudomonadota bacterium]
MNAPASWIPRLLLCGLAALGCDARPAQAREPTPVVATDTGRLRGFVDDGVREYRGIPFARPPTGERRFAPPVPQPRWPGVLDASHHRSPCPQVVRFAQTDGSDDEDCLYLNVAVPAAAHAGRRAVLVWIHGGAYVGGSADIYPLRELALRGDLVVVSVNYRLGALGFLAHPALDPVHAGAVGLEDQREALRWIRRNIAAFGGDPRRVTLAGESAGASSVCLQLVAPERSRGLFDRAIIQSIGCPLRLRSQEQAVATARALAERVQCVDPVGAATCLRAVPVPALLEAQTAVAALDPRAFVPSIGTVSTPRQPLDALQRGEFLRVPILNGGNRDEMRLYVGYEVAGGHPLGSADVEARLRTLYGTNAARVASAYPRAADDPVPAWLGRMESDYTPDGPLSNCLMIGTARLASRWATVYQYEFTDDAAPPVMPDPGFPMGAVHSAELAYFFPKISFNHRIDGPDVAPGSRALARQMVEYWSAFVRDGRPAVAGLPVWPAFRAATDVLRLDPAGPATFDADAAHHCELWRELYPDAVP